MANYVKDPSVISDDPNERLSQFDEKQARKEARDEWIRRRGGSEATANAAVNTIPGLNRRFEDASDYKDHENWWVENTKKIHNEQLQKQHKASMQKQASDFQDKVPGLQDQFSKMNENAARRGIAQELNKSKASANSRGLLFSGKRQAQDEGIRAQAASQLAQENAKVQTEIADIAAQMNQQATDATFHDFGQDVAAADAEYARAVENMSNRNNMLAGLGQAGGVLVGSYLASRKGKG